MYTSDLFQSKSHINEDQECQVLYINDKPVAKYADPMQAKTQLAHLQNKFPTKKIELKKEMREGGQCNMTAEGQHCPAHGLAECGMWEASDPSGMMHAARHYNKSFIITAKLAEGGTKKYRIHAQSERVAREKFSQHYNMAKVLSVEEEGMAEGEIAEVNDEWFKQGAFKTFKKAAPVKYQLAQQPGTVDTLEGPVRYEAGHYIMTGPKGERYPISPDKFNTLYDDNGDGTATPKKISKLAKLADHDGVLHTSWGDLQYTKGNDYIVRHGTGDYGAVKKDIFAQTYDNLGQGVAEGLKQTLRKFDPTIKARIRGKSQDQTNQGLDTIQHLSDLDLTSDDMVSRAMKPNTYFRNAERYAKLANKGMAEDSLNEFDPGEGGMPPFTVYVGDTLIDKFASYDEAQEEVKYQRGLDPRWAHDQWKIVNGIGETVWEYDVGEKSDDMRRQHKIQFIPRDNKDVEEGETTLTKTGRIHRSTGPYGGSPRDLDPLGDKLNKTGTKRIEKSLGVNWDRKKEWQGGVDPEAVDEVRRTNPLTQKLRDLERRQGALTKPVEQMFHVTADQHGANKDVPLYTKTYPVRANSEQEAINTIRKIFGGRNHRIEQGVAEGSSENKYSNLSNRGVNRGINRAGDDFNRMMDLDQVESPHYKTQHQQDTKQRLKTKPMAGPKGVLPEQGVAEGLYLDEGITDFILKAKDKFLRLKDALSGEWAQSKQMWQIVKKGNKSTSREINFANNQFKDILKMVGLAAWYTLPLPGNTLLILGTEKLLNRFGMSIMPDKIKNQVLNVKEQGVAEGSGPESQKFGKYIVKYFGQIYDYGDDGLEYLDNNAPFWFMLFDKHNGDIDDIIANEPADVLKKAALELKAVAGDLKYELDEQGVAEAQNDYFKRRKDEEDRIAGTKAPAKRTPKQTDYEKKRKAQDKDIAEGGMPSSVIKSKQRYGDMLDKDFAELHQSKSDDDLVAMAWRHGYGKGSLHYVNKRKRGLARVEESRLYYNVIGTRDKDLKESFGMQQDQKGWFLEATAGRKRILEAHKAFGAPTIL